MRECPRWSRPSCVCAGGMLATTRPAAYSIRTTSELTQCSCLFPVPCCPGMHAVHSNK